MTDDIHQWDKPKKFRKRKAYENVSGGEFSNFFTKNFNPDATGDLGLWCGECRRRQPWKKLVTGYEIRSHDVYRIWFCPQCDDMLREDNLTDLGLANELDEQEKRMDLSGQVERMDALERGTEELLGMSMKDYAVLCDEHPKRAKKVLKAAMAKAKEHEQKRLKKLKKRTNKTHQR